MAPVSKPERRLLVEEGPVEIHEAAAVLNGDLAVPERASGLVIFAHGTGSGRLSPRNQRIAAGLRHEGFATLLMDLRTEEESKAHSMEFDLSAMTTRLEAATTWAQGHPGTIGLPIGYFGSSTGAAVALLSASELGTEVRAVISRGGRPDLVGPTLQCVQSPTMLIVGSRDQMVLELNRQAFERLGCRKKELAVVPGASHLFEEAGALEQVLQHSARWFRNHLGALQQ